MCIPSEAVSSVKENEHPIEEGCVPQLEPQTRSQDTNIPCVLGPVRLSSSHILPFSSFCSKAVESLAEGGGSELQQVKEDARKRVQQVEERLTERILILEGASLEIPRAPCCFRRVKNRVETVLFLLLYTVTAGTAVPSPF